MGLDTTHNCWHGSYSGFMAWRIELAKAANLPPLIEMDGFSDNGPGISWMNINDPICILLNHSDCDGSIDAEDCIPLADRLVELIQLLPEDWHYITQQFIDGLRDAAAAGEDVRFG